MFFAIVSVCFLHVAYEFLSRAVIYVQYIALNIFYEQVFLRCICSHRGVAVYHADRRAVCVVDILHSFDITKVRSGFAIRFFRDKSEYHHPVHNLKNDTDNHYDYYAVYQFVIVGYEGRDFSKKTSHNNAAY